MSEISSNNQLNCLTIPRRTEHTVGRNIIHKLFSHSAEALMENFVSVILWVNAGENWEKFCVLCESFSFPLLLRLTNFERHENDINKQIHGERMRDKNKEREEIKKKLEICVNHNRRLRYMRMRRVLEGGKGIVNQEGERVEWLLGKLLHEIHERMRW